MAYDELRQQLVLFGGYTTTYVNDTWEYDGAYWTQVFPSTSPTARSGASMVYDSARGRILLFGGWAINAVAQNQLWAYNGTTWTLLTPAHSPPRGPTSAWSMTACETEWYSMVGLILM